MPRGPRLLLSHSYYHVMTRGNNRQTVFSDSEDFYYYISLVKRFKAELPFQLYHYCLMPNHTHMLIQTVNANDFSTFMKKINLAYFWHFRNKYGWVGHLWQDRFKSQAVGKDSYFIQCGKYIELNPLRAELVQDPVEYAFSSYRHYAMGEKDDLISNDMFYLALSEDANECRKRYQRLMIESVIEETYEYDVWAVGKQAHNEEQKIRYHQKKLGWIKAFFAKQDQKEKRPLKAVPNFLIGNFVVINYLWSFNRFTQLFWAPIGRGLFLQSIFLLLGFTEQFGNIVAGLKNA